MSMDNSQIRDALVGAVNEHLKNHATNPDFKSGLTSENWTRVISGCKSLTEQTGTIAKKLGIKEPADLKQFATLDDAVDYCIKNQQ